MTNLATRSLVALFGIPLIIGAALLGGIPFFLLIGAISLLSLSEFYSMARTKGVSPQVGTGLVFGFLVNLAFFQPTLERMLLPALAGIRVPLPTFAQTFLVTTLIFLLAVVTVELTRQRQSSLLNGAVTVFGVAYVSMFLGSLIGLREIFVPSEFPVARHFPVLGLGIPEHVAERIDEWGGLTVATVFSSLWICDSAAYFAGKAFGKHKLAERISPNKTLEGAVAGFIAAVVLFPLAKWLFLPYLSVGESLVCGVIVGVFGQVGDLVESMMKRDSGIKDSSTLIPGHGGMLDRFDSLILVAPLLFLYFDFVVFAR